MSSTAERGIKHTYIPLVRAIKARQGVGWAPASASAASAGASCGKKKRSSRAAAAAQSEPCTALRVPSVPNIARRLRGTDSLSTPPHLRTALATQASRQESVGAPVGVLLPGTHGVGGAAEVPPGADSVRVTQHIRAYRPTGHISDQVRKEELALRICTRLLRPCVYGCGH